MAPRPCDRDGVELQVAEALNDGVASTSLLSTRDRRGRETRPLGFQQTGPSECQPARLNERDGLGNRKPPAPSLEGNDGVGKELARNLTLPGVHFHDSPTGLLSGRTDRDAVWVLPCIR